MEEYNVGIVLEDLDFKNQLVQADGLRESVLKKRHDFTIEENLGDFVGFYKELKERARKDMEIRCLGLCLTGFIGSLFF